MNRHILRAWPPDFKKLSIGQRSFVFVVNNTKYNLKDLLLIQEYNAEPDAMAVTGNSFEARIIDYTDDYQTLVGLQKGYAVITISKPFNLKIKYRDKI